MRCGVRWGLHIGLIVELEASSEGVGTGSYLPREFLLRGGGGSWEGRVC